MTDDIPKRPRGRPRVHATPEEARLAGIERANAATRARRQAKVERTIALSPASAAKAEALVAGAASTASRRWSRPWSMKRPRGDETNQKARRPPRRAFLIPGLETRIVHPGRNDTERNDGNDPVFPGMERYGFTAQAELIL